MRAKLKFWAKAGAPKSILQWIAKGVTLPFSRPPPPHHQANPPWSEEELGYWRTTLLPRLLTEGAVIPVSAPTRYVSASRLEAKRSGGFRHIVDLRPLNTCLHVPKCKYETLSMLPFIARPKDAGITLDM